MKSWLKVLLIILLTAFVYRDSFTSPFFQDDKILLELSRSGNIFQVLPNFPYRPVSQSLFYFLGQSFFGNNVLGYHLILFLVFAATVFIIFRLSRKILKDETKALVATFFYALNVSLFANFYWVATSYFTIGALFFFLTLYFYLENKTVLAVISYLLALGSNEIAFVLPILLVVFGWYLKYWPKKIILFLALLPILLWLRLLVGFPKAADYVLSIGQTLATTRWYFVRILNLPEGVRRGSDNLLSFAFVIVAVILFVSLLRRLNSRLLILGGLIFILSALPFFFLPSHMSSYYLTIALFGPALVVGEIAVNRKLLFLFVVFYLLLTIRGLDFLSKTHWIILKNTGPIGKF